MKNYIIILIILFFISCKSNKKTNTDALNGKYDIKKAIVKTQLDFLGLSNSTTVLMFDDYGKKHKQIKYDESNFVSDNFKKTTYTLIDDQYIYIWENESKNGSKIKLDKNENDILAQRFNFKKLDDNFKKEYKIKQLADKNIKGKNCNTYQMEIDKSKITYYVWKNIPLSFDLQMDGKTINSQLIELNENPTFKPTEFDIPEDIHFEEIQLDEHYGHQH